MRLSQGCRQGKPIDSRSRHTSNVRPTHKTGPDVERSLLRCSDPKPSKLGSTRRRTGNLLSGSAQMPMLLFITTPHTGRHVQPQTPHRSRFAARRDLRDHHGAAPARNAVSRPRTGPAGGGRIAGRCGGGLGLGGHARARPLAAAIARHAAGTLRASVQVAFGTYHQCGAWCVWDGVAGRLLRSSLARRRGFAEAGPLPRGQPAATRIGGADRGLPTLVA